LRRYLSCYACLLSRNNSEVSCDPYTLTSGRLLAHCFAFSTFCACQIVGLVADLLSCEMQFSSNDTGTTPRPALNCPTAFWGKSRFPSGFPTIMPHAGLQFPCTIFPTALNATLRIFHMAAVYAIKFRQRGKHCQRHFEIIWCFIPIMTSTKLTQWSCSCQIWILEESDQNMIYYSNSHANFTKMHNGHPIPTSGHNWT